MSLAPEGRATHQCLFEWGVRVGEKNISRPLEALHRHLLQGHAPTMIPERFAKRVRDLTEMIVRIGAYPVAYGGFSDVWSCQLQDKKSPPKRVRFPAIVPMDNTHYGSALGGSQGRSICDRE